MTEELTSSPSFESRIVPQSRKHVDADGNLFYEHNEWLKFGEKVVSARGGPEMTFMGRYRNPLNCQELVTLLRRNEDGSEELVDLAVSAVRRTRLAA